MHEWAYYWMDCCLVPSYIWSGEGSVKKIIIRMVVQSLTHPVQLLEMLNNQRMQSLFTDINVIVSGQHFSVHRCFLAAHSNVLCTVLQESANQGVMNLSLDILDPYWFSVILDFMYSSKLNVTDDNVHQIKETAMCLQVNTVVELCEQYIASHGLSEQAEDVVDAEAELNKPSQYLKESSELITAAVPLDVNTKSHVDENITAADSIQPNLENVNESTSYDDKTIANGTTSSNQEHEGVSTHHLQSVTGLSQPDNLQCDEESNSEGIVEEDEDESLSIDEDSTNATTEVLINTMPCRKRGRKPKNRMKCDICSKLLTKTQYKIHMRTHTGEKEHQCPYCKKRYSTIYNLQIHQRQHTGEKPYNCEICSKSFADPSSARKHQLWHADIRNHQCQICSKRFLTKAALGKHMVSHTHERPYVCQECGKSYRNRCDLNSHNRIHTGDLYGPCEFCGKKFNHRGNYLKHLNSHRRDKPSPSSSNTRYRKIKSQDEITDVLRELAANQIPSVPDAENEQTRMQTNSLNQTSLKFASLQDLVALVSTGEAEVSISDGKFFVKSTIENVQMENNIDVSNLLNTGNLSQPVWDNTLLVQSDSALEPDTSSVLLKDSNTDSEVT